MAIEFWVWLGILALTVILEVVTLDLVSIWFAIGSVIPLILACFPGMPIWVEVIVFVVVSALLLAFMRKVALKVLYRHSEGKTNLETFQGQTRKLLEDITFDKKGAVRFNGVVWSAVTEDKSEIKAGNYVDVLRVEGNTLVVRLSKKTNDEKTENKKENGEVNAEEKGE